MSSPCCENGRSLVNPHTGQTVCSCQYPPGLLTTYSRMGLPDTVYSNTAYSTAPSYMALGSDPSAFYPPLNPSYELKEAAETWRGIGQSPGCYPYDPSSMPAYPYPNAYGAMDINSAARRKNATRENTNTLKAWLYEHRKNPYPTKGEKIMLAIITKMTLTQVSTWFANARRRLKKENKMTWSPRNKPGTNDDDDDDEDEDDSKEKPDNDESDGGKSPKGKSSCDKEGHLPDNVTAASSPSSSSSLRKAQMYDTPPDSAYLSRSRLPCINSHNLRRCPSNFPPPDMNPETSSSFLNLPPAPHNYPAAGGTMSCLASPESSLTSATDGSFASLSKRPDSLCSNSNDSGLSDANCSYPDSSVDGLRPKIWSLAHVATSDGVGYTNHNNGSANNNINSLLPNMGHSPRGLSMTVMAGSGLSTMTPGLADSNFSPGRSRLDNLQTSSSSLSSFPPSPSIKPILGNMSHWGTVYSGPPNLGSANGKPSCQGTSFCQPFPGMMPGRPMTSPTLNSVPGSHVATPSPGYSKNISLSTGYYQTSKMSME